VFGTPAVCDDGREGSVPIGERARGWQRYAFIYEDQRRRRVRAACGTRLR